MSIYRYPESNVIDEVTFRKTENGAIRAYLHARPDADVAKVQDTLGKLKMADYECIPFTFDGKPALEVRGFRKEAQLTKFLAEKGWIQGSPNIQKEQGDKIGWMDQFRKRSLQASGLTMAVADTGFIVYGIKEARLHKKIDPKHKRAFEDALAGLCYLGGSTVLSAYGRNDQSNIQIREMAEFILQHAREKGFKIPEDSAAADLGGRHHKQTLLSKVDNFFREYPSEIGNMLYFGAGALIALSAQRYRVWGKRRPKMTDKQFDEMHIAGWGDTALGVSTMTAGLIGTFVKEKAPDPDKPKREGIEGAIDWLKAHPLSVAAYLYIGSTLCHAFTTWKETTEARRIIKTVSPLDDEYKLAQFKLEAIPWRILFVGATLVGELLLSISSKGHGEGVVSDNTVDNSVVATAADLIVKQPTHRQEQLIDYMAKFLGQPAVLAMKDQEVTQLLRTQVENLRKNPWAQTIDTKITTPAVEKKAALPAWQAKVSAPQAESPRPGLV